MLRPLAQSFASRYSTYVEPSASRLHHVQPTDFCLQCFNSQSCRLCYFFVGLFVFVNMFLAFRPSNAASLSQLQPFLHPSHPASTSAVCLNGESKASSSYQANNTLISLFLFSFFFLITNVPLTLCTDSRPTLAVGTLVGLSFQRMVSHPKPGEVES